MEQSQAEALAAAAAAGDNLICQAIINSGIALGTEETVVEETETPHATEEINKVVSDHPEADGGVIEIQVKEEFVEMEEVSTGSLNLHSVYIQQTRQSQGLSSRDTVVFSFWCILSFLCFLF